MPYAFVPIIIIFLSLGAIILIVVNKFPQLRALDISTLPQTKEAKVKEAIKYQKFNRGFRKLAAKTKPLRKFSSRLWRNIQGRFREFVQSIHAKYQEVSKAVETAMPKPEEAKPPVNISGLLSEADNLVIKGDVEQAERRYLAAIKLDPKATEAYRGLGGIYFDQGKYRQAKETYEFIIKLSPNDDRAYNRLGRLAEMAGDWGLAAKYFEVAVRLNNRRAICFFDLGRAYAALNKPAAALRNFLKAVQLEPNNPKYLDQLLEMSIISGDSELAREIYERLRLTNPDNQKLAEFKQRIEEMES